jgi:hypothetical protein
MHFFDEFMILITLLAMWITAFFSAIASLFLYIRRPKPWYVRINLATNISGLLFTIFIFIVR